jgi:hypothetical protein
MRITATRLITLATVFGAIAVGVIYSGAARFLADDASVSIDALWCIVTYWALFVLAVLLIVGMVRRRREMALACVSVLLLLALAEVALRVARIERAMKPYAGLSSSRFHHVNEPNAETFMGVYDGHPVVIRTNEDGLRTDLSREEFLSHRERVLVMGDSFVWGMGVRQENMLTEVMQSRLRERTGDDVGVLAGAAISYSPLLLRQLYRSLYRHYRPTKVLLVLDASDIGDDLQYARENVGGDAELRFDFPDEKPKRFHLAIHQLARPVFDWIGHNLMYPYYTFIHSGTFNYDYYDFELRIGEMVEKNRFFIYRHPLDDTRVYFESTLSIVSDIAREAAADGASFALVVAPRHHHWSDRECPENWEIKQYKYTPDDPYEFEYLRFFREAASRVDYDVVDLSPAFERTDRYPLVFVNDPHWNDDGHDFVAGLLADYLLAAAEGR